MSVQNAIGMFASSFDMRREIDGLFAKLENAENEHDAKIALREATEVMKIMVRTAEESRKYVANKERTLGDIVSKKRSEFAKKRAKVTASDIEQESNS